MADAARAYILGELVTRENLRVALDDLELRLDNLDQRLTGRIDSLAMRLTIRLGVMIAAAVGVLSTMVATL